MIESFVAVLVRDLPQGEGMILGKKENGSLSILLFPLQATMFLPFPWSSWEQKNNVSIQPSNFGPAGEAQQQLYDRCCRRWHLFST